MTEVLQYYYPSTTNLVLLPLRAGMTEVLQLTVDFLLSAGRMKFVRPLFRELCVPCGDGGAVLKPGGAVRRLLFCTFFISGREGKREGRGNVSIYSVYL